MLPENLSEVVSAAFVGVSGLLPEVVPEAVPEAVRDGSVLLPEDVFKVASEALAVPEHVSEAASEAEAAEEVSEDLPEFASEEVMVPEDALELVVEAVAEKLSDVLVDVVDVPEDDVPETPEDFPADLLDSGFKTRIEPFCSPFLSLLFRRL